MAKRIDNDQAEIVKALISVAEDEKRPDEQRRSAIFLLGKMKTPEARQFLIQNVTLRIPVVVMGDDESRLQATPCRYALYKFARDWNTAEAILTSLKKTEVPAANLLALSTLLEACMTKKMAMAVLNVEWERVEIVNNPYKQNIKRIREYLK